MSTMNAIARLFSIIVFIFVITICKGQDNCNCKPADTLRQTIGKYYNSGKLDSAALVLTKLKQSTNKACRIVYLDGLGQIFIAKKQFADARNYFSQEEIIQDELNCKNLRIRFYNTLARYYQEAGYRDSVSMITLKAITLAEEEKDWYAAARASINLASIFQQEQQLNKYLQYSRKALSFARLSKDTVILAAVLTRVAESYFESYQQKKFIEELDSSYLLATECISISRNRPENLLELSDAYSKISQYYIVTKQYNTALTYADSAIVVCPKGIFDFYRHQLNGYSAKSEIFFALNNYKAARAMADSAYRYALLFNKQLAIQPLNIIFKSSRALKDFERSSAAQEEMMRLRDSIYTIEKTATINELEKKYNQAKNEKTIQELSLQKKIYLLFAVVAVLAIGVVGFFLRQQSFKHKQKVLETEQRLNRARINPHFFFNALTSIQHLILQKNDQLAIASNLAKFSSLMRNTLENTYNDYITIEQELAFLKQYLDLQLMRFPGKFTYLLHSDDDLEIDEWQVPSMIVQPFVENCIEHGFAHIDYTGHITVDFLNRNNQLHILITDNGRGFNKDASRTSDHISRAGQILKDRIYLLNLTLKSNASFSITERTEKGVSVAIKLPAIFKNSTH
ncbi:MAG TPA: hypothetical protein DHW64_07255 [Chitinophagaceae bacterium]|nr:hypothetical protein [Chitinophagaceae bacterium]